MKLIGEGVSSCVIHPPYACKNKTFRKNHIGKLMNTKKAVEEEIRYKIVDSLDPKRIFSPAEVLRCIPVTPVYSILKKLKEMKCGTELKNDIEQIVMTYHGTPLHITDLSRFTSVDYVLREVNRLLYCTYTLRSNKYSHMDLHSGNVLVNPESGRLTVIDFGELTADKDVYQYIQRRIFTKKDYTQFPPELVFLSVIVSREDKDLIVGALKNVGGDVVRLLKHGVKTGRGGEDTTRILKASSRYLEPVAELLDPSMYPRGSRDTLYAMRCGSLLSMIATLRTGNTLAYLCAMSFVTIDSYAIGRLIGIFLQKTMNRQPKLQEIVDRLSHTSIQKRISAKEALIDIRKPKGK